jgi:ribose transport system ATP-binding protein
VSRAIAEGEGGARAAVVLALAGIEKSFGPVPVLRGVDLEVRAGEVHAVLGENGAGKSTLMRILLGIERADRGSMLLGGAPYAPRGPASARASGVVMVPQERTLCPHLDVVENIVLGIEPSGPAGLLRRGAARAIAERALGLVAGEGRIPLAARARELRVADQQLVEIARALAQGFAIAGTPAARESPAGGPLALGARVLVLDEPTASLGKSDADRLFERVRALKATGLAVVLVTHFLGDVRSHADRYTVLRDGEVRGAGDPRVIAPARIVHEMLGRELETAGSEGEGESGRSDGRGTGAGAAEGEVLLELRGVAGVDKPRAASFVLRRGEILGIAGLVGSGRTELLRAIVGLDPVARGEVARHAPRGIGLLSEDRGGEGLMLGRSIADNVELSPRGARVVWPAAVRGEAVRWIEELSIRASGPDQRTSDLSGGNQQKVQIARLLREDYDVLLVDEPTRGIDVASKAQVLELLRALARRGKGIVLVSSQLEELVTTCDRIAVLARGELAASRPAAEWDEQRLLLEAAS